MPDGLKLQLAQPQRPDIERTIGDLAEIGAMVAARRKARGQGGSNLQFAQTNMNDGFRRHFGRSSLLPANSNAAGINAGDR